VSILLEGRAGFRQSRARQMPKPEPGCSISCEPRTRVRVRLGLLCFRASLRLALGR
jgi:hypothetical protein